LLSGVLAVLLKFVILPNFEVFKADMKEHEDSKNSESPQSPQANTPS